MNMIFKEAQSKHCFSLSVKNNVLKQIPDLCLCFSVTAFLSYNYSVGIDINLLVADLVKVQLQQISIELPMS